MAIINRKTEALRGNYGRSETRAYISITEKCIYFTAAISRLCNLEVGLFVQFDNDGDNWNFFVNDDPDGFKLTPVTAKGGFHINNSALNKMILSSMGFHKEKRFAVIKTGTQVDGRPVFNLSVEKVSTALR